MNKPVDSPIPASYIDNRPEEGVVRVDRSIFTDPELFELEMEKIWEGNWIYMAHESQIPNVNDFMTLFMGRQPIILVRMPDGEVGAFANACAHRGTTLLRETRGNRADYTCPFHGWSYDTFGNAQVVFMEDGAGYPECFDKKNYSLTKVPKLQVYKGFIFGSLNDDVLPFEEHMGPALTFIDLFADQSPEGMEVLKGSSTYTYKGNWKIQAENGVDGYHLYATHGNYVMTTERRRKLKGEEDTVKAMQIGGIDKKQGGYFDLDHGHVVLWGDFPNPQDRPNYDQMATYAELYGEERAKWMVNRLRNLLLYPNVFIMDQTSSQIRVFRPISVDETEVTIYGIAPKGESAEARAHRIRQWEDFFNVSGMATPDDITEFKQSQISYTGKLARWNDCSRGLTHQITDENHPEAEKLGIQVKISGVKLEDEGIMVAQHEYWSQVIGS
ncbi:MAG: Rieske 2Fe-2S domain-containing protein [Immundisolibacteraceae bacterium]|nr:Rieske 2Fe-2S domain-containing protein [Immundisolibacteraceae bacterium]